MTTAEILNEIYDNNLQDEVFSILALNLLAEKNRAVMDNRRNKATLRLIGKVTKDKTVLNILEED